MQRMIALDALESTDGATSQLQLPRVNAFQAIDQAAAMVDRFDKLFMRALRQLRDLRRYTPTVVVQRAEQVNVGQQQLNLASGGDASQVGDSAPEEPATVSVDR